MFKVVIINTLTGEREELRPINNKHQACANAEVLRYELRTESHMDVKVESIDYDTYLGGK